MRLADTIMSLPNASLRFVLEAADEARLQGDNYKAETLIAVAYDLLDRQSGALGQDPIGDMFISRD